MKLRRLLPFALVAALLTLPVLTDSAAAAPSKQEIQVSVVNFEFQPKSIEVKAGDTVVWTNNGTVAHTVTASDGSWDSGRLEPGATFSHTFDAAGTVPYYCKPHGKPDGTGMAGTVVVLAASTGAAPAPAATQAPAPAAPAQPAAQPSSGGNSLDVSDQPLDDDYITVPMVMAANDGWLVVHANTPDNKPGTVLGETAVKAGENTDVEVHLNPRPNPGDKVWPMLHIDAPQKGVYEFPGADTPVADNGSIVMKQITITAGTQAQGAPSSGATSGGGQVAGAAPPQVPQALPNTGEAALSNISLALLGIGAAMIVAGMIVAANIADRRQG